MTSKPDKKRYQNGGQGHQAEQTPVDLQKTVIVYWLKQEANYHRECGMKLEDSLPSRDNIRLCDILQQVTPPPCQPYHLQLDTPFNTSSWPDVYKITVLFLETWYRA